MQPKITDQQRHILELLNTGWQIGVGHGMSTHHWIQKFGAGRGGETERVTTADTQSLLNQRLIYRTSNSFPTSTIDITEAGIALLAGKWTDAISEKVKALLEGKSSPIQVMAKEDVEAPTEHPSYGQISISHTTGQATLYGASVRHNDHIALRIRHSSIHRNGSSEHHHGGKEIIEVALAYDQFVGMLFNSNRGDGVPCTIQTLQGERIPPPELTNKRAQSSKRFASTVQSVTDNAATLKAEAERILKTPGGLKAAEKEHLLNIMHRLVMDVRENIPFIEKTFQEQVDKSVMEVETQLARKATALGLGEDTTKLLG